MRVVALCSGGKDSSYALWLAMRSGHEVVEVLAMVPEREDSWMYHTANIWLIDAFGECAGLPVRKFAVRGGQEAEQIALRRALSKSGAEGVVSGVIASRYQLTAIESACALLGMKPVTPLWGRNPSGLMREIVREGFDAIITLVAKPVVTFAAVRAHFSFSAVISTRLAHKGNISAKVSTTVQMCSVLADLTVKVFFFSS